MTKLSRHDREWVKLIGKRRLTAFERALSDPELVSLRQELARIDALVYDAEERAKRGGTARDWRQMAKVVEELRKVAAEDELSAKAMAVLDTMEALITESGDALRARDEVADLIELRRRVSDTERKYEELHQLLIPAAQVTRLFDDLHGAIEHVIVERAVQLALFQELRHRLNGEARDPKALVPATLPDPFRVAPDPVQEDAAEASAVVVEPGGAAGAGGPASGDEGPAGGSRPDSGGASEVGADP